MITRSRLLFSSLLALAVAFTFLKIPLASSQGMTLVAAQVSGDLPLNDPNSELWQETTAIAVPLSAQVTAKPIMATTNVKSVDVRALYNGQQIAFLVEWEDETQDESSVRVQDFRDAVALQFPLIEGQPFFCMGQQGGDVNIWHWKADWQADIVARQDVDSAYPDMYVDHYDFANGAAGKSASVADYEDGNYVTAMAAGNLFASPTYHSPVEDLIAGSFGTLTAQPAESQNVMGHGEWAGGKWRVIFGRDLVSPEGDDVSFDTGQVYSLAFAAWDGANEERNGQKSTSQWLSLQLGGEVPAAERAAAAAAAPAAPVSGSSRTGVNTLEGLPYVLVPMAVVFLLVLAFAGGVALLSRLPAKKR